MREGRELQRYPDRVMYGGWRCVINGLLTAIDARRSAVLRWSVTALVVEVL
jgi:hypothetical protein